MSTLDLLGALDELLIKALKISELSQISRTEVMMRRRLGVAWSKLAAQASRAAGSAAQASAGDVADRVGDEVDEIMGRWSGQVTERFVADTEKIYRLGREAGWKKGTGRSDASLLVTRPSRPRTDEVRKQEGLAVLLDFDLVDEKALASLRRNHTFWLGVHYDQNVSGLVRDTARDVVEEGLGRQAAGRKMAAEMRRTLKTLETPTGWRGTDKQYFEMLAANASTVGRVHGQLKSFNDLGFDKYVWIDTGDERECARCSHMGGKIFEVPRGMDQMRAEIEAEHPDDIRTIHPWLGLAQIKAASPRPGPVGAKDAKALQDLGIALPPLHGSGRCSIDVA